MKPKALPSYLKVHFKDLPGPRLKAAYLASGLASIFTVESQHSVPVLVGTCQVSTLVDLAPVAYSVIGQGRTFPLACRFCRAPKIKGGGARESG